MKIYISTPVTSRQEKTILAKRNAAKNRCSQLVNVWKEQISDKDTFVCFNNFTHQKMNDAEAMGLCIEALLTCDAILIDRGFENSKGCRAELQVAKIYGLRQFYVNDKIIEVCKQDK